MTWNYSTTTAFMNALNAYRTSTGLVGTFFEFIFDNSGFPGLTSPVTIIVDNIRVISPAPVPEPASWAALAGADALGFVALRRRRRS